METKVFLNQTPVALMGVREHKGDLFGIELELEGRNVGLRDVATRGWQRHEDGSLRGESIEYTTTGAKPVAECKSLVDNLFSKFKENGVKFNDSIRTSTHVHLNFADKPLKQAINFFTLFTMLEEPLQYYSGEDRKGNLFCISTREAEGIVGVLASGIAMGSLDRFAGDRYKYAACNLSTLYKFGTIEVRTMRGANSADMVNKWLDILDDMYQYSLNVMKSPADLVVNLSHLGAEGLMHSIFKPANYTELMKTFPKVRTLHQSLMDGARLIQLFAFEFDEDFKAEVDIKKLVGGRMHVIIPEGPFRGQHMAIYRPNQDTWNVAPHRRIRVPQPDMWRDGDKVTDARFIEWSEERQRFIVRYGPGDVYECNWRRHPQIPDEGPGIWRELPRQGIPAVEPDWEVDEIRDDDDF